MARSEDPTPAAGKTVQADAEPRWRDLYISARDGLRLHARDYGERGAGGLPVVCLPGLTRNARDFHELALHLSTHPRRPRRVLAIDYRGRGRSDHDRNWRNYTPMIEAGDVLDMMVAAGLAHAAVIGTSRGGIIAMILATMRPSILRAVVLNDIGPEIDGRGLLRIKNTLQATRDPRDWPAAASLLKRAYEAGFPDVDEAGWMAYARRTYVEEKGRLRPDYDPALLKPLARIDFDQPLSSMWQQFDALGHIPVLAIRGANSDLLSARTLELMQERRPDMQTLAIENAGHSPHLTSPAELKRIADFLVAA